MKDGVESHSARPKAPPKHSPIAGIDDGSRVDRVLAGSGVLLAFSSLGFAGYMVASVDHPPQVAGLEYLAIFSRPSHFLTAASVRPPAWDAKPGPARIARSVDMTPTGSIADQAGAGVPTNGTAAPLAVEPSPAPAAFELLYASGSEGVLRTSAGILRLRVGDMLPTFGRINSIESAGGRWTALTQSGARLEWRIDPETTGAAAASAP
jgi:hypothetical protein